MSIVRRPQLFTPPTEDFAQVPASLDSWDTFPDRRALAVGLAPAIPGDAGADDEDPTPRWRSISVTSRTEELDRLDGFDSPASHDGLVDALVRLAHDAHVVKLREELADGRSLAEAVAALDDQVVWSEGRVVAILRALPDGSLEAAHFPAAGFLDRKGVAR